MEGLNTVGHAINNEKSYLDAGCKALLGCTAVPDGKSPPSRVIVDIEAQNEFKPGYAILKRGSFYCGRMISAQKETVFRNSDYNKLQKVYSIWLCIAPDEDVRGVCNAYNMSEICLAKEHHFPKEQYDNFCIILACLQDKQSANNMVRFFSSVFDNEMPVEARPCPRMRSASDG